MEQWFRKNYEDPANNCPYESAEGGYFYIWGGPYDAHDVLYEEFEELVPANVIDELAERLDAECSDWSAIPPESYETEDYKEIFIDEAGPINTVAETINDLEKIVNNNYGTDNEDIINQMVLVYAITALETFLSDYFIIQVSNYPSFLRAFVEKNKEYKELHFSISELYTTYDKIKDIALENLRNVVWHNLAKVSNYYNEALGIVFPKDIGHLYRMISIRHDVVHRGGKTKSGEMQRINKEDIDKTFKEILRLARFIDSELPKF